MISVELRGADELKARFERILRAAQRNTRDAVVWGQQRVAGAIRTLLRGPALASRSGNLAGSVAAQPIDENPNLISGRVGTSAIYARVQNYGGAITARTGAYDPWRRRWRRMVALDTRRAR